MSYQLIQGFVGKLFILLLAPPDMLGSLPSPARAREPCAVTFRDSIPSGARDTGEVVSLWKHKSGGAAEVGAEQTSPAPPPACSLLQWFYRQS